MPPPPPPDPAPSGALTPQFVCAMLDSLGIALCTYDSRLRAVRWNRTFLKFFPEHANHIHVGEHYRDNLERFYRGRLVDPDDQPIARFVADGIRRHVNQTRPFTFFHQGRWLRVSCQPADDGSMTRVWVSLPTAGVIARPLLSNPAASGDALAASHDLHASFENVADGVMVLDPRGRIVSVNEEFVRLYRSAPRDALFGLEFRDVMAAAWRPAGPEGGEDGEDSDGGEDGSDEEGAPDWRLALADRTHFTGAPFELPLPGGRWVRVMAHESSDSMRYSVHVDITAFKRQERDLRRAERQARRNEARFRAAFDHAGVAAALIDADIVFVDANAALCRLLGEAREALVASRLDALLGAGDAAALAAAAADLRAGRSQRFERDVALVRGHWRPTIWVRLFCTPVGGADDAPAGLLVAQFQDITATRTAEIERDRLVERLRHQATHDPLTGLFNRMHFEAQAAEAIRALAADAGAATASGPADPPESACLCFFDLDGFKAINDAAGHAAGDAALRQVAALFAEEIGDDGLIARVGGDEFAVLLRHHGTGRAEALAARVVARLQATEFRWEGSVRRLGVSIGIAALRRPDTLADALHRADAACYDAKRSGGGRVRAAPARPASGPQPSAN